MVIELLQRYKTDRKHKNQRVYRLDGRTLAVQDGLQSSNTKARIMNSKIGVFLILIELF